MTPGHLRVRTGLKFILGDDDQARIPYTRREVTY